jgi:integrase/recombinase XerD
VRTELQRVERGAPSPPVPRFAQDKLVLLPETGGDVDPYWRLAAAFLVGYPPHSSRAYFGDLRAWYTWCAQSGVHPLAARRHHVDAWIRQLSQTPQPTTGRPASPASIARRLSCLSKFYDYGIKDAELLEHSPIANVRRPKVSEDSPTIGLTAGELDGLLTAAEAHGRRSAALVSLLVYNGLRIAEVLACDVDALTHQRGHRVLRIVRKGGKASTEPLAAIVLRALENYITERTSGPIFLNADATARLSYSTSFAMIRRLARRAGIAGAERISPHSLRHSFATELLGAGVPLQDVQDAMGHADPRTTRAYDRSRHNLDRHPTYKMAANLHRSPADESANDRADSSTQ